MDTVTLREVPSLESKHGPFGRLAHLAEVFAFLSSEGNEMLESQQPLTYKEWSNLQEWAFAAWYLQSSDKHVATFFEAVVERGINDCHHHLSTVTIEDVTAEAKNRGFLKGEKADDTLENFWCNHSLAREWLNNLVYQFGRLRSDATIKLSQLAVQTIAVPFELMSNTINPQRLLSTHWIENFARYRFPSDKNAQLDWVEKVAHQLTATAKHPS